MNAHPPETANEHLQRWHIRVRPREPRFDGHGRDVLADIRQMGLSHIEGIESSRIYFLRGRLAESDIRRIADDLIADAVVETFTVESGFSRRDDRAPTVEVHPRPGVMNPVALSAREAIRRWLRVSGSTGARIDEVQTARRYRVVGARDAEELEQIAVRVLANDCIETWYLQAPGRQDPLPERLPEPPEQPFTLRHVPIEQYTDKELVRLSREGHLFLSLREMHAIRDHFAALKRDPTDLELETFAQSWSEHCVHKTLKSAFEYHGDDFGRPGQVRVRFGSLLKETIFEVTATLNRDWCLSVFVDNAGVVGFDEDYGIAFKVETHNHPSAIDPYGGASTGIGGCIRDVMGCGLGAKPIASTDVFCLAPPDFDVTKLPKDVLHPRRVLKGVVRGVRDYGNRMGIPTVNGAIIFDDRYLANPLVFCGCVGLIPRNRIDKKANPGDRIVLAGGRTGRDGIHGATFSSAELTDAYAEEFSHAVQIGNAIEEKKLLDALLLARDDRDGCLYSAITDCGAGGISCAVSEMGAELGAVVDLERVPLKYAGLRYDEIWISEAQERMVLAVPPDRLDAFIAVCSAEEVEATVIGTFADDRILRVRFDGQTVGELDLRFLHGGLPEQVLKASWRAKDVVGDSEARASARATPPTRYPALSANDRLLNALGHLNVASKEWVIRQYDHEVQGRSVIKPLAGPGFGPSDAAVLRPRYDRHRGIAIACGICPDPGDADPYWMAVSAVDEALRNVICVGADPSHTAILDNFCWPKVDTEESLGALVRSCVGARDAALAYGLPFISGKDSLNNEFTMSEQEARRTGQPRRIAIPGTLLISAVGMVDDVRRCVSMDLKQPGNRLVLASAPVDRGGLERAFEMHGRVSEWIRGGKVVAAHDVSDGGLAVTIAEMCIAADLGAAIAIQKDADLDSIFASPATTYVLEMTEKDAARSRLPILGRVESAPRLRIETQGSETIDLPVTELAEAWRKPLADQGARQP